MVIHDSKSLSSIDKIMSPFLQLVHANLNVKLSTCTKLPKVALILKAPSHTYPEKQ